MKMMLRLFADELIAICNDNACGLMSKTGKPKVVYNPVDMSRYFPSEELRQNFRREFDIPDNAFVCLFAGGSNQAVKGIREFLQFALLLKNQLKDPLFLLPGCRLANLQEEDNEILNELGGFVRVTPFTKQIERYILVSDVVFVLHNVPHFSRTVIEAAAVGVPTIATRVGGIKEVVDDAVTGFLVDVGDCDEILNRTMQLFHSDKLRKDMGYAASKFARSMFSVEEHARQVEGVYENLVRK